MSNTIDLGAIALGMAVGYGLRKELKATGEVCRNALLAGIAGAAATAAAQSEKVENPQSQPQQTAQPGQNG